MLRIYPLGGLGEVGMNCLALEQRGEVLIVDCGVTFDDRGLGVDVVHADFRGLDELGGKVVGVFLTHGHEDHIGALPYFLKRYDVPVWGPPYALGLVRHRAEEHEILDHVRLHETQPRQVYEVGSFLVEPIRVTHSIADATALAITTDSGTVIHTGDFKFDPSPPDGQHLDEARFRELGDRGVDLLFSDSTNIDARGPTGSEAGVGDVLSQIVDEATGAVIVGLFASNVHRLRLLGDIARRTGRKLVPLGRSITTHSRIAHATGYLKWPSDLVVPPDRARDLPRSRILAIATGTQAEPNAALARLARQEHPSFSLAADDTVVFSSRVIPGNEPRAYALLGDLIRRGVRMRTWASDRGVHVSGHAHREEQRRMLELVRPRSFIPVHGTLHHMTRHGELAREVGVGDVCILENGDVAALEQGRPLAKIDKLPSGRVHVYARRELSKSVLKERMNLAAEGVMFIVVVLGRGHGIAGVRLATRGIFSSDELEDALGDVEREIVRALGRLAASARAADGLVEAEARLAARRALFTLVGYKPCTVVLVEREGT